VRYRVADFVLARALRVVGATAQALAARRVAVGEARAADAVGPAVAWVDADAQLADVAGRTHPRAVATEARVVLRVDAAGWAALEAGITHAIVKHRVAHLVLAVTLRAVHAARKTLTGRFVAVAEARAVDAVCAAVSWVDAAPGIADLPGGTGGVAITAVTRIGLRVHTIEAANAQRRLAVDSASVGNRGVGLGAAIVRWDA
jgi:hypothetical protein